jgi:hypothetical protein
MDFIRFDKFLESFILKKIEWKNEQGFGKLYKKISNLIWKLFLDK